MKWLALMLALLHLAAAAQQRTTATTSTKVNEAPTQIDSADLSAARYWGLTIEDYRRYQALMKGVRGAISNPHISPIEVLGIHARNDAERRKYAEMFARLMAEDTQRVLQFQLEYDRAFRRLHPKLEAIELGPARLGPHAMNQAPALVEPLSSVSATSALSAVGVMSRPPTVTPGDRILVFTRNDCAECDALVQQASAAARDGTDVDLYLVGARSAEEAQRYARRLALDPALVNAGRITVNLDGGTLARVLPSQHQLPALVRKRGASLVQLALSDLNEER